MYQYKGKQTIQAELAAIEAAKQELAIREAEHAELMKLRKERRRIEQQAQRLRVATDELAKESAPQRASLPEPIHGGPVGLELAAREIAEHEARKRAEETDAPITDLPKRPPHGTVRRYRQGCRCIPCKGTKRQAA